MDSQIRNFKASLTDGNPRLRFFISKNLGLDELRVCVYRKDCPDFQFNLHQSEFFDFVDSSDADLIFDGPLETLNRSKVEYIDQGTKVGRTYCYWVSLGPDCPRTRPIGIRVRDPEVWWPYERTVGRMTALTEENPGLVQMSEYGMTVGRRSIQGLWMGNRQRVIALVGLIHAGEAGPELILPVMERLSKECPELLEKVGVAALPAVNVDRREAQVEGVPSYLRRNANDVDLNRNFPGNWEEVDFSYGFLSSDPDAETYRGPFPGSEPETLTVMNFINQTRPLAVFSHHCLASLCTPPFLASHLLAEDPVQWERARAFARAFHRGFYGDDGQSADVRGAGKKRGGRLQDWLYLEHGTPGFDLEFDGAASTSVCLLDHTDRKVLEVYAEKHFNAVKAVLEAEARGQLS